jgi:hypothetical protein
MEIERGVDEQVVLLHLPQKISFETEQCSSNEQQSSNPW